MIIFALFKPGPARQETSFLHGASKVSYTLVYNGKSIRLKVSYKRGVSQYYKKVKTKRFGFGVPYNIVF